LASWIKTWAAKVPTTN